MTQGVAQQLGQQGLTRDPGGGRSEGGQHRAVAAGGKSSCQRIGHALGLQQRRDQRQRRECQRQRPARVAGDRGREPVHRRQHIANRHRRPQQQCVPDVRCALQRPQPGHQQYEAQGPGETAPRIQTQQQRAQGDRRQQCQGGARAQGQTHHSRLTPVGVWQGSVRRLAGRPRGSPAIGRAVRYAAAGGTAQGFAAARGARGRSRAQPSGGCGKGRGRIGMPGGAISGGTRRSSGSRRPLPSRQSWSGENISTGGSISPASVTW